MYHRLLLHFIQQFSYLQQYLFILFLAAPLLLIFKQWWCLILIPLSTISVRLIIQRLSRPNQSPLKASGYLYKLLVRKPSADPTQRPIDTSGRSIETECDTYIRTIIARYICVWYYPLISQDQEFLHDISTVFHMMVNRLYYRLKSLDIYEVIRLIINIKQKHMTQYLHVVDSCRKQSKQNRASKSVVGEFGQAIGFHSSIVKNDFHAYFRGLVELLLTELLPETMHIYSASRPCREFLVQLLVNCLFLQIFQRFSQPKMIYYLLVVLLESEEQKKAVEMNGTSVSKPSELMDNPNEKELMTLTGGFADQPNPIDQSRKARLERIIYSATIISTDTAFNSMSGAAYTVYIIQCETKSPYTSDATHRYTIRRRFREFTYLHKRLQQNPMTSQYCYDIDDVYRVLPQGMDHMNSDIIQRRKCILEQYIQRLIYNEVLNCSHDILEFFAFNSDPNIQFEASPSSKLIVPRANKTLFRTLTDVGTKLNNLLPARRETTPLRETFQLNVSGRYEEKSYSMEQLKQFNHHRSSLQFTSHSATLNSTDSEFLQLLLTRPSIVSSRRREKNQSPIPLTDAVLNLIHTSLHSRDAIISNESVHQILRTTFGHLIEQFLKNEIDELFSQEKIIMYLSDLRTEVLWPDNETPSTPMKNVKHRAFNALINKIPMWLQYAVGVKNVHQLVTNLLQCLSHEELNRHLLLNIFDFLIEQLVPDIAREDFLTKYVYMHAGLRS